MAAPERWEFGVEALPQTVEAARRLRRVTDLVLAMEGEDDHVAQLIAHLQDMEVLLATMVPPDSGVRIGPAADGDGRVYIQHARDVGAYNPGVPEYALTVDGDRAGGTVTFPIAFEGPPGCVHGGFLAVLFDCVIQHHNCDVGVAGKTTALSLRYRRPTPLLTELRFELERAVDNGRITSTGRLFLPGDDGRVACEAEMRAAVGDRANLPAVSPRRGLEGRQP
jgi:acyl-coenzyme A thioesterase PaaI-like protein